MWILLLFIAQVFAGNDFMDCPAGKWALDFDVLKGDTNRVNYDYLLAHDTTAIMKPVSEKTHCYAVQPTDDAGTSYAYFSGYKNPDSPGTSDKKYNGECKGKETEKFCTGWDDDDDGWVDVSGVKDCANHCLAIGAISKQDKYDGCWSIPLDQTEECDRVRYTIGQTTDGSTGNFFSGFIYKPHGTGDAPLIDARDEWMCEDVSGMDAPHLDPPSEKTDMNPRGICICEVPSVASYGGSEEGGCDFLSTEVWERYEMVCNPGYYRGTEKIWDHNCKYSYNSQDHQWTCVERQHSASYGGMTPQSDWGKKHRPLCSFGKNKCCRDHNGWSSTDELEGREGCYETELTNVANPTLAKDADYPPNCKMPCDKLGCLPCPAGKYKSWYGIDGCVSTGDMTQTNADRTDFEYCPDGTYQDEHGQDKCKQCPSGWRHQSSLLKWKCYQCEAGKFSAPGSTSCSQCPLGRYSPPEALGTGCIDCPLGKYRHELYLSSCFNCPMNQYTQSDGASSRDQCVACPVGKVNAGGEAECSSCSAEAGTFTSLYGCAQHDNICFCDGDGEDPSTVALFSDITKANDVTIDQNACEAFTSSPRCPDCEWDHTNCDWREEFPDLYGHLTDDDCKTDRQQWRMNFYNADDGRNDRPEGCYLYNNKYVYFNSRTDGVYNYANNAPIQVVRVSSSSASCQFSGAETCKQCDDGAVITYSMLNNPNNIGVTPILKANGFCEGWHGTYTENDLTAYTGLQMCQKFASQKDNAVLEAWWDSINLPQGCWKTTPNDPSPNKYYYVKTSGYSDGTTATFDYQMKNHAPAACIVDSIELGFYPRTGQYTPSNPCTEWLNLDNGWCGDTATHQSKGEAQSGAGVCTGLRDENLLDGKYPWEHCRAACSGENDDVPDALKTAIAENKINGFILMDSGDCRCAVNSDSSCKKHEQSKSSHFLLKRSCSACPAGWYKKPDANVCEECGAGQYQDETSKTSCKQCSAGKSHSGETQSTTEASCSNCDQGRYQAEEGQTDCDDCPSEKYSNEEGEASCKDCSKEWGEVREKNGKPRASCYRCNAGFYKSVHVADDLTCTSCPINSISPTYSSNVLNCTLCPIGFVREFGQAGSTCTECQYGKFAEEDGTCKAFRENECVCKNGDPVSDDHCHDNEIHDCGSCETGFEHVSSYTKVIDGGYCRDWHDGTQDDSLYQVPTTSSTTLEQCFSMCKPGSDKGDLVGFIVGHAGEGEPTMVVSGVNSDMSQEECEAFANSHGYSYGGEDDNDDTYTIGCYVWEQSGTYYVYFNTRTTGDLSKNLQTRHVRKGRAITGFYFDEVDTRDCFCTTLANTDCVKVEDHKVDHYAITQTCHCPAGEYNSADNECTGCPAGYHSKDLPRDECTKNVCQCEHGVAATSDDRCYMDGLTACDTCEEGYSIPDALQATSLDPPHDYILTDADCEALATHMKINRQDTNSIKFGCMIGSAKIYRNVGLQDADLTGLALRDNSANLKKYFLNEYSTSIWLNMAHLTCVNNCACPHGTPAVGLCSTFGEEKCTTCDAGYGYDNGKCVKCQFPEYNDVVSANEAQGGTCAPFSCGVGEGYNPDHVYPDDREASETTVQSHWCMDCPQDLPVGIGQFSNSPSQGECSVKRECDATGTESIDDGSTSVDRTCACKNGYGGRKCNLAFVATKFKGLKVEEDSFLNAYADEENILGNVLQQKVRKTSSRVGRKKDLRYLRQITNFGSEKFIETVKQDDDDKPTRLYEKDALKPSESSTCEVIDLLEKNVAAVVSKSEQNNLCLKLEAATFKLKIHNGVVENIGEVDSAGRRLASSASECIDVPTSMDDLVDCYSNDECVVDVTAGDFGVNYHCSRSVQESGDSLVALCPEGMVSSETQSTAGVSCDFCDPDITYCQNDGVCSVVQQNGVLTRVCDCAQGGDGTCQECKEGERYHDHDDDECKDCDCPALLSLHDAIEVDRCSSWIQNAWIHCLCECTSY